MPTVLCFVFFLLHRCHGRELVRASKHVAHLYAHLYARARQNRFHIIITTFIAIPFDFMTLEHKDEI